MSYYCLDKIIITTKQEKHSLKEKGKVGGKNYIKWLTKVNYYCIIIKIGNSSAL